MNTIVRKATKSAALPPGLLARRSPADVVGLLYHRVGPGRSEIELSIDAFERQLAWLRRNVRVLTIDEALAGTGGVVVTFDDGTPDFHSAVLPRLVRQQVPAILYLATSWVGDGTEGKLTWAQLADAVATGLVTIGSHTHTHADLSRASAETAREEMRRSKELIEDRLGAPCRHFAYPWAVGSPAADKAARELFDSAALDAWRTNRPGRTDPYRIGRVPILRSDGDFFFRQKVAGRLDTEAWIYRALGRGPWGRSG